MCLGLALLPTHWLPFDAQTNDVGHPGKKCGVFGVHGLLRAPHFDVILDQTIDTMHTVMVIAKGVVQLMKGERRLKPLQRPAHVVDDAMWARTAEGHAAEQKKQQLFILSKKKQDIADRRYKSIRGPVGTIGHSTPIFQRTGFGFCVSLCLCSLLMSCCAPFHSLGHVKAAEWDKFTGPVHKYVFRGLLPKAQFDVITKLFDFLHRCVAPAPTGRDITEVLCPAAGCTHFCKFVFSSLCCVGQLMFLRAELIPVLTEHFPFAQQSTTLHAALHLPGWPITFCCCHLTVHARWRLCVWRAEQMLRWGPSSTVACWAPER